MLCKPYGIIDNSFFLFFLSHSWISSTTPAQMNTMNYCKGDSLTEQRIQSKITTVVLAIFFVSLLGVGMGQTAVYTLGIPYIDDNVASRESPLYFGKNTIAYEYSRIAILLYFEEKSGNSTCFEFCRKANCSRYEASSWRDSRIIEYVQLWFWSSRSIVVLSSKFQRCREFAYSWNAASMHFVTAITIGVRILGPALGFILGSLCTMIYADLSANPQITPTDPRWVGAWWLGKLKFLMYFLTISSPRKHQSSKLLFYD